MMAIESRKPEWVVFDMLRRRELMVVFGRNCLTGQSDSGKSFFVHWLCVRIAAGGHVYGFDEQPKTSKILYLSWQDSQCELSRKKEIAWSEGNDACEKWVFGYGNSTHYGNFKCLSLREMNEESAIEEARECIASHRPEVIVVDSLNRLSADATLDIVCAATQVEAALIVVNPDNPTTGKSARYYAGRPVDVIVECKKNPDGPVSHEDDDIEPANEGLKRSNKGRRRRRWRPTYAAPRVPRGVVSVEISRAGFPARHTLTFGFMKNGYFRIAQKKTTAGVIHLDVAPRNANLGNGKRSVISTRQRYRILELASFRCVACGATPSKDDVKLHIDHIVPVSRGGSSDESNLQVLCEMCNLGKGDMMPRKVSAMPSMADS